LRRGRTGRIVSGGKRVLGAPQHTAPLPPRPSVPRGATHASVARNQAAVSSFLRGCVCSVWRGRVWRGEGGRRGRREHGSNLTVGEIKEPLRHGGYTHVPSPLRRPFTSLHPVDRRHENKRKTNTSYSPRPPLLLQSRGWRVTIPCSFSFCFLSRPKVAPKESYTRASRGNRGLGPSVYSRRVAAVCFLEGV